jgi:hypothetical protein
MHETRYSGVHRTVRQSRERVIDLSGCKVGGGVVLLFSNAMRGKFILLRPKKIFLYVAIPSSRSVLLTPLHYRLNTQFKLRSLAVWKV